jgi:radical SAM enzyme (TIGR01210 family)
MIGRPEPEIRTKRELSRILRRMRELTPRTPGSSILQAELDTSRIEIMDGKPVSRAVITLRSTGCDWARRSGGCTMCGHLAGASVESEPSVERLNAHFDRAFDHVDWARIPVLCLYNGGSVLSSSEVPDNTFEHIVARIAAEPRIRLVALESRPEFVDEQRLNWLAGALGGRSLRVAIGLESARDDVRELAIHKGITLQAMERVARIVTQVASLRLYVLIKPPWLTEQEAIDDAVDAVRLARRLGATDIHFEPATIQRHTLVYYLWSIGRYRMPWLWSIREILRRLDEPVYVSPFAHVPPPIAIPHNCPACSSTLMDAIIRDYNNLRDPDVLRGYSCRCEDSWRDVLSERDTRPLSERIMSDLPLVEAAIEKAAGSQSV